VSNPNLSGSITFTDGASAVLRQVRGEVERTNTAATKGSTTATGYGSAWGKAALGIGVATIGVGALIRGLQEAAQEAAADEKQVRSLSQTLANLGKKSDLAGLQDFVDTTSEAAAVADDQLRPALQRLITATGSTQKAQQSLRLALDISAGSGKDLMTVSTALAKAYSGQTTALGRLGVGLDQALLKSGDMDAITQALTTRFRGQASQAANSYAGRIANLSIAVDEAKESIGYGLLQAVDAASDSLGGEGGFNQSIRQAGESMGNTLAGIGPFIDGIHSIGDAIADATAGGEGAWGRFLAGLDLLNTYAGPKLFFNRLEEMGKASQEAQDAETRRTSAVSDRYMGMAQALGFLSWAQDDAEESGDRLEDVLSRTGIAAQQAKGRVNQFKEALDLLNGGHRDAIESESAYRQAIDDLADTFEGKMTPAVNKAGTAFNLHREGGRLAAEALNEVASSAEAAATAAADEGNWRKARRLLQDARGELVDQAVDWGLNEQAAKDYVDQILKIPTVVKTQIVLERLGGAEAIQQYRPMRYEADGGYIVGPGTDTSDSIPARLSNGEYVVRAAAVRSVGRPFLDSVNAQGFKRGGPVGGLSSILGAATQITNQWANQTMGPKVTGANDWYLIQQGLDAFTRAQEDAADNAKRADEEHRRFLKELAREEARRAEEVARQQQAAIDAMQATVEEASRTRDGLATVVAKAGLAYGSITGSDASGADWAALSRRSPGSPGAGSAAVGATSISGFMAGRLDRIRSFGDVLNRLSDAGLNAYTLRELWGQGPEAGYSLGKALLDAGVGEVNQVNTLQQALAEESAANAASAANRIYGGYVGAAYRDYNSAIASNGGVDRTPLAVNLYMDGRQVLTQLLALKWANGGVSLGLD
jgi:hypothetical protein